MLWEFDERRRVRQDAKENEQRGKAEEAKVSLETRLRAEEISHHREKERPRVVEEMGLYEDEGLIPT